MTKDRIVVVDIAKGLGIFCIVLWHLQGCVGTESEMLRFLKQFVCQFHVPLFFFISGMFFRKDQSWGDFLKKKFFRLYVPFVVANVLFVIIESLLRIIGGEAIDIISTVKWIIKICLGLSWTNMGGATWFLLALFRIMIIYKIVQRIFRGGIFPILIISLAITVSGIFTTQDFCVANTLYFFVFFALGNIIAPYDTLKRVSRPSVYGICLVVLSLLLVCVSSRGVSKSIDSLLLRKSFDLIVSGLGVIWVFCLSGLLVGIGPVRELLLLLGRNSMSILVGHFAAFKLIVIIQVIIVGESFKYFMAHPCYNVSFPWSLAYLLFGLALPVGVPHLFKFRRKL